MPRVSMAGGRVAHPDFGRIVKYFSSFIAVKLATKDEKYFSVVTATAARRITTCPASFR